MDGVGNIYHELWFDPKPSVGYPERWEFYVIGYDPKIIIELLIGRYEHRILNSTNGQGFVDVFLKDYISFLSAHYNGAVYSNSRSFTNPVSPEEVLLVGSLLRMAKQL